MQVVKDLVASFEIITSIDNQGNTALDVAAYRGYLKVVEFLIHASPTLASVRTIMRILFFMWLWLFLER